MHLVSGEIDKSIENYYISLKDYKDDPDALFGLGTGYLIKGDTLESQKYFSMLIDLELFSMDQLIEVADVLTDGKHIEFGKWVYEAVEEMELNEDQKKQSDKRNI